MIHGPSFEEVFRQMFGDTPAASQPQQPQPAAAAPNPREAGSRALLAEIDRMERLIAEELARQAKTGASR